MKLRMYSPPSSKLVAILMLASATATAFIWAADATNGAHETQSYGIKDISEQSSFQAISVAVLALGSVGTLIAAFYAYKTLTGRCKTG